MSEKYSAEIWRAESERRFVDVLKERSADCRQMAKLIRQDWRKAMRFWNPGFGPIRNWLYWHIMDAEGKTPDYWDERADRYDRALVEIAAGVEVQSYMNEFEF